MVFPPVFNSQLEAETTQAINDETSNYTRRKDKLDSGRITEKPVFGVFTGACTGIGATIGTVLCVHGGFTLDLPGTLDSFIYLVMRILIGTVAGLVLGLILDIFARAIYRSNNSSIDNRIASAQENMENRQKGLALSKERRMRDYLTAFETDAQNRSVDFAGGGLARDATTKMGGAICDTIDSADRRPHITQVNAPFVFKVFANKITWEHGEYDLEIERWCKLESPIAQAALARAIASAAQLDIRMAYPTLFSDTNVVVNIAYGYTKDSAIATVTYQANNGNYRPPRNA